MMTRFDVNGNEARPCLVKSFNIVFRMHNHQMHVQRFFGVTPDSFHYGNTEGNVRDKYAIHHVHMDPVGLALIDHTDFLIQAGKITGQYGRRYQGLHSDKYNFDLWIRIMEGRLYLNPSECFYKRWAFDLYQ